MKGERKALLAIFGGIVFILLAVFGFVSREKAKIAGEEAEAGSEENDTEHIIITYQTLESSRMDDIEQVVDAVNEISRKEIGVEIELKMDNAQDSFVDYPLWISQDEQVDLMILNYQDISNYIASDMLKPLDSLLKEYGQGIENIIQEGEKLLQGSVINGKIYGVSNVYALNASGGGIWISEDLLGQIGVDYEKNHVYSYEELDEIFGALKALYPDSYPLGQLTTEATATTFMYYDWIANSISDNLNTGVIVDGKVCDLYETEEYKQFLVQMREWYEKGYIFPDAAFTDESQGELYEDGKILTKPFSSAPGMADDLKDSDMVCLKTTPVLTSVRGTKSGFWVIPASSRNPEAAMKFLNLMLCDTRIGNLFKWGIEGVHYVRADEEAQSRRILYPEGVEQDSVGYYNPMMLYGDYRKVYTMDEESRIQEMEEYAASAEESTDLYDSFAYDKTAVSDMVAAVEDVIEKYVPVLESGSVDLDIYYTEFVEKLSQAGMPEIIKDKQEQLDAWQDEKDMDGES